MSDDLSKLTPTDPSSVDPGWSGKRKSILDDVLADTSQRRRGIGRWVAGAAAAAVVVAAIGGAAQQFRPTPYATPAPPPSTTGVEQTDLVAARSVLLFTKDGAKLCRNGAVEYSRPPQCEGIPVENLSTEDVPSVERAGGVAWTPEVVVTGTFDGTTLTAMDVFDGEDPDAPQPIPRQVDDDIDPFGDLCSDPVTGRGPGDRPLGIVEQELPGYQGTWGSGPHNVAVTRDVEAARSTLAQYVQGDFCVGTVPGGSAADGYEAEKSISSVEGVEYATYSADARGARLLVMLLTDDDEAKAEIETLVGPEQWAYTAVLSFFYPVIRFDASDPTATPIPKRPIVAAQDMLIDTGTGMTICNGTVLESRPPGCPFATPIEGITWDDVPRAETADDITFADAIIVGTFDDNGEVFSARLVFRSDDPTAPQPPKYGPREASGDGPGPTDQVLQDAQQALKPLMRDVATDSMTEDLVWRAWTSVSELGNHLEVSVRRETPALLDKIEAAVGPDVWPHTDVVPFFYPVDASASPDPVEHSPGPYGSLPATAFTDEQRGWAEDSVASALRSSDASDRSDVTARMAKLTYGEYMTLWGIDVPDPPGPPSDDTEVLVVALSAPVDGSSLHGGPATLVTPTPTASQLPPPVPVGTVTVLDPITGETLSHAFIVGGTPPAKHLSQMAWLVEDVPLPDGYR